jgi:hypothetical protein
LNNELLHLLRLLHLLGFAMDFVLGFAMGFVLDCWLDFVLLENVWAKQLETMMGQQWELIPTRYEKEEK